MFSLLVSMKNDRSDDTHLKKKGAGGGVVGTESLKNVLHNGWAMKNFFKSASSKTALGS